MGCLAPAGRGGRSGRITPGFTFLFPSTANGLVASLLLLGVQAYRLPLRKSGVLALLVNRDRLCLETKGTGRGAGRVPLYQEGSISVLYSLAVFTSCIYIVFCVFVKQIISAWYCAVVLPILKGLTSFSLQ